MIDSREISSRKEKGCRVQGAADSGWRVGLEGSTAQTHRSTEARQNARSHSQQKAKYSSYQCADFHLLLRASLGIALQSPSLDEVPVAVEVALIRIVVLGEEGWRQEQAVVSCAGGEYNISAKAVSFLLTLTDTHPVSMTTPHLGGLLPCWSLITWPLQG